MVKTKPTFTPLRFGLAEAQAASDDWRFNCGPGALCAVLGMTPDEIRPHLLDFEAKGYSNPTLMADILRGLGAGFRRVYECQHAVANRQPSYPRFGLVRVQWSGPWTREGVPIRARYRHTHWIAHWHDGERQNVFDINAIATGGWMLFQTWMEVLVPWLLKQVEPKADGQWWPTHCWELT